ncbi:MAG TPA: head GIN domain-containing protein [Sphingomonadaceae bacterium]|nr:head GIN domain-containing protein [Sphingomonadaceae bacterium]
MKTAAFALFLLAPLMAAPAHAAERGYSVTDFDRIRVDGPYRVTLTTGRSPGARAVGAQAAIEGVAVEVQGRTLIVRRNTQTWGGYPGASAGPVEVRVTGYTLRAAALNGAGSLAIDKVKGASLDLVVAGSGLLTVGAIEADRLTVGVTGNGRARIAGKAAIAQLGVRGTGSIEATALVAKDAKIAADGPGEISVTATVTAGVVSAGAGQIVVLGNPACTVKATGSGTVTCGK